MIKRFILSSLCMLFVAGCSAAPRRQLVIDERLLSGPPDISSDQLVFHFAQGDQDALLARTKPYKDFLAQAYEYNRQALEPLGFNLKLQQKSDGGSTHDYVDIYRGDQLIARDAIAMQPVSLNAAGTDFIGIVDRSDGTYLFTKELFESRQWSVGRQPYAYVGNRLLSVEMTHVSEGVSRLQVYLDYAPVYDSQFNSVSTYEYFDGPLAYDGHWALVMLDAKGSTEQGWEPLDRLIVDGKDQNSLMDYEQAFQFSLVDGKPFYFYQKEGKIGISFNGEEIAKGYDEIPHYACCTDGLLNPGHSMNMVWFFARRGADWYYVEAYLPPAS